jgi:hypothetical protein
MMATTLPRPFGLRWENRPFGPVEFPAVFPRSDNERYMRDKPTWRRRVVNTLSYRLTLFYATTDLVSVERSLAARNGAFLRPFFLPFDPVLRDHGPCVRGAIIGRHATTDPVSVERSLAATAGLVPGGR